MPSREDLLESIRPGMKLAKSFFKRIYGYEITEAGFADQALEKLEAAGCTLARQYYKKVKAECDREYDEAVKPVAVEYARQLEKKWNKEQKEGEEQRKQEMTAELRQMSNSDLIALCASLTGVN